MLFQAGAVDSLAAALRCLVESPDLRRELGRAGRSWVREERTWRANGDTYPAPYEGLSILVTCECPST